MWSRHVVQLIIFFMALLFDADVRAQPTRGVEGLLLSWPDSEGWHVGRKQDTEKIAMVELLRGGESLDNWTELGTMTSYKGARVSDIASVPSTYLNILKQRCPDVRMSVHHVDREATYPRVIFSFDCPAYANDGLPESGVWMAVQGRGSLYIAQRSVRRATVPDDLRSAWVAWMKSANVVVK